ncbi:Ca-activated chloride channel family protein [Salinibacterium sp. CAN_S4]|uniref:vWA domain-containing protein n=1 Tax=Salinibacterium sp. CAN_S4 TaxID=2787727 RepID=UPI0018EFC51A
MTLNPVAPIWLLLLVGLALAALMVWQLVVNRARRRLVILWSSRLLMVALLLVIAVRPTILGDGQGPSASGGLEVYLVVDTTTSMAAEDWDGEGSGNTAAATRLDGVKSDIALIVSELNGAQFSLVTFDAVAVQRVPLTSDSSAVLSAASVLRQEVSAYSRGSSIDEPLDLMSGILLDAATQNPEQRRVLFYFGDGEQTSSAEPRPFDQLAPYLQGGAVLGYGTADGGRMQEFNGVDERYFGEEQAPVPTEALPPTYIQDYSGGTPVEAVSVIDETALGLIAGELGIVYEKRSAATSTALATTGIEVGDLFADEGEPGTVTELYWIFAIPFGLLALLQIAGIAGAIAELRPARRTR